MNQTIETQITKVNDFSAEEIKRAKEHLVAEMMPEHIAFTLPEDPARRSMLEAKLNEYHQRMRDDRLQSDGYFTDTPYKALLLQEVLEKGRMDIDRYLDVHPDLLSHIVTATQAPMGFLRDSYRHYEHFLNAAFVIADYCLTGGKRVFNPDTTSFGLQLKTGEQP